MPRTSSPLRYPGGKTQLTSFVRNLLITNNIVEGTYIEPFAGGAGVAIQLLLDGDVNSIVINDYDKSIYSIWYSILNNTEKFISLIFNTPITIDEWYKQKAVYLRNKNRQNSLEGAFATFFLNRTNVSGIISGGPIGGMNQTGKYKIDCRFNKVDLIRKIRLIADRRENITLYRKDALELIDIINENYDTDSTLIFFDPPYYVQGKNLYLSFYSNNSHKKLFEKIGILNDFYWITTYDYAPQISEIYHNADQKYEYELSYSVNKKRKAKEFMFASEKIQIDSFDKVLLSKI
ncbi:TPA: DNA adenine methylase [Enterococcus faecalis]|uniref:DNA adenine methylase n=1 Tax=Bacilli TaxID=91061 RepID=UPI00053C07E4|nr:MULTISPECIES: DNA adenine methylase [Bacilli]KII40148.1 DNA methyltransferase [Enterococcus faecalis]MBF2610437.1 DNA adenine methylase [Listeria welshimeri]HBI1968718.1 DNA adenine methylase [Enterococcus faecalis]HBI2085051.1 DNA adenine methylase [Enterococcus faecalis]HBK4585312.1 DNA adenine methylase [Enterococcus faecalis]